MIRAEKQIKGWFNELKNEIKEHKYLISLAVLLFIIANVMNLLASSYVDQVQTTHVSDIILDNIPIIDLDFIFVYGFLFVVALIIMYTLTTRIGDVHKALGQFALLVLVRSFFLVLTHLGQPLGAISISGYPQIYQFLSYNNDLFFSGHTAVPFLAFLLFRKDKIGKFFLIASIILAATVLFAHLHYSIDVFSAFFITYGTYKMGEWVFGKVKSR